MQITPLDSIAFIWFSLWWLGYTLYAKRAMKSKSCLAHELDRYRLEWMTRLLKRDMRIADATIIAHLERNGAFFASSTLLILAALFAMLGATEQAISIVSEIPYAVTDSRQEWELKILLLICIFIYSFFTFTWSMRQYNFCAIMIGGAPMPDDEGVDQESRQRFASQAARLIDLAANQFNYGLRAYYFGLAVLGWFIHPVLFMIAVVLVVLVLFRREFHSKTLHALRKGHQSL